MDALRSAEAEHQDPPETNASEVEDSGLALQTVEVTTESIPANEPRSMQPNGEPLFAAETRTEDTLPVTEATLKSSHPARRITLALLAGVLIILATTGGYYYWNKYSSSATAGTLIANPPVTNLPAFPEVTSITEETAAATPAPAQAQVTFTSVQPSQSPDSTNIDTASSAAAAQTTTAQPMRIEIHRGRQDSSVDPLLVEAYSAYQHRDYLRAGQLYSRVLRKQPGNRDALLGIAGVSILTGDTDTARRYYEKLLDISPGDSTARAALQSMQAGIDPLRQSSRLQHMLESDRNNAHLHFSLGNRYLELGEWKKAQQAFFDAVRLAPDHPDYNYNLAVSLDHLAITDQALVYYQRAQELARFSATLFNSAQLERRIHELQQTKGGQS